MNYRPVAALCALLSVCAVAVPVRAQTLGAEFVGAYSLVNLGPPAGVTPSFGGLTLKSGDINTLLLGGGANGGGGNINEVSLVRSIIDGKNRITGFSGTASQLSTAPNIDGGLIYAPNGTLLYTGYSNNILGQILPGSNTPNKIINLNGLIPAITSSVGTIQLIPGGFGANSGKLLIASYNSGDYFTADLTPDGFGTYDLTNIAQVLDNVPGGPEGIVYVPGGSPLFPTPSVLVSEYSLNRVSAYEVDALGIPIVASRRDFVTGLGGAEGATIDLTTGDFLFSTFGGNPRVISVRGFAGPAVVPEAGSGLLALLPMLATGAVVIAKRRRKAA